MKTSSINKAKRPILIAQVDVPQNEEGGDFYYRAYAPGLAMSKEEDVYVVDLTNLHPRKEHIMREADILVLNNICDPDVLPILWHRKQQGKPTVYELYDDICSVPPWNPVYQFYSNPENTDLIKQLASYCDGLQFSSEGLKELYGYLNPRSVVFSNHILTLPAEKRYTREPKTVIGWGGSFGHLEDMRDLAASLIPWMLSRSDVYLHLMCADPLWELFESVPEDRKKRFQTGSILDYYNFLDSLDIGIAPLNDSSYNRCRSDVKFIEYGAHGVVPVVQASPAYTRTVCHGQNGFLFNDHQELVRILDSLMDDYSLRIRSAIAAREYVQKKRLLFELIGERVDFYRSILASQPFMKGNGSSAQDIFESIANEEKLQVRTGRHLMLIPTHFELLLRIGVSNPFKQLNVEECRAIFDEASRLEPENYLPHLLGAACAEDRLEALLLAAKKNPKSISTWKRLGEELLRRGELSRAVDCFKNAARIFPPSEPPSKRAMKFIRPMKLEHECQVDSAAPIN